MFFSFTRRDANSCSWTRRHASVHAKRVRKKQKLVRQAGSVHNKKKSREKRKISLKDFQSSYSSQGQTEVEVKSSHISHPKIFRDDFMLCVGF